MKTQTEKIKRKKLALKEQVANAKNHLDGLKSKYYDEIKAGSKLLPEQQKAVEFFNRYNKELEETNKMQERQSSILSRKLITFSTITSKVLNILSAIKNIDLTLRTLIK